MDLFVLNEKAFINILDNHKKRPAVTILNTQQYFWDVSFCFLRFAIDDVLFETRVFVFFRFAIGDTAFVSEIQRTLLLYSISCKLQYIF